MKKQTILFGLFLHVFFAMQDVRCAESIPKKSTLRGEKSKALVSLAVLTHRRYNVKSLHGGGNSADLPVIAVCRKKPTKMDDFISIGTEDRIFVWNLNHSEESYALTCRYQDKLQVLATDVLTQNGEKLVKSEEGHVCVYDTVHAQLLQSKKVGGFQSSWKLGFSPDEKKIVGIGMKGCSSILFDLEGNKLLTGLEGIHCCGGFSADNLKYLRIACWGSKKEATLYDAQTGKKVWIKKDVALFPKGIRESVDFNRWSIRWVDGGEKWYVDCGLQACIYEVQTGKLLQEVQEGAPVGSKGGRTISMDSSSSSITEDFQLDGEDDSILSAPDQEITMYNGYTEELRELVLMPKNLESWSSGIQYEEQAIDDQMGSFVGWDDAQLYLAKADTGLVVLGRCCE